MRAKSTASGLLKPAQIPAVGSSFLCKRPARQSGRGPTWGALYYIPAGVPEPWRGLSAPIDAGGGLAGARGPGLDDRGAVRRARAGGAGVAYNRVGQTDGELSRLPGAQPGGRTPKMGLRGRLGAKDAGA